MIIDAVSQCGSLSIRLAAAKISRRLNGLGSHVMDTSYWIITAKSRRHTRMYRSRESGATVAAHVPVGVCQIDQRPQM